MGPDRERMDLDAGELTVSAIVKAGAMLMKAGAEVYRVEDTMARLGQTIEGVEDCIPYVTTTGVMCSIIYHGLSFTRIARIKEQGRNIEVINAINSLSRRAQTKKYTAAQIFEKLGEIATAPVYSDAMKALFGAIGAGGFAIFFGGNMEDVIATVIIGLIIRLGTIGLEHINMNDFLVNAFLSTLAGIFCLVLHHFVPGTTVDTLIISSIMLLVPGLAIMNAIRDIMMGEYLSGSASLVQAMFVAAAIAIGIAVSLYVGGLLVGAIS